MGASGWNWLGRGLWRPRGALSFCAGDPSGLSRKPLIHSWQVAPYDLVRVLLGAILLVAAGLKGHQLATEPLLGNALLPSRWFLIGVVQFEVFLGLCLCVGLWPQHTRNVGLLCFAVFACISLYKGFTGAASCGCFGRLETSPWLSAFLDLTAVAALLRWRPCGSRNGTRQSLARVVGLVVVFFVVSLPATWAIAHASPQRLASLSGITTTGRSILLEPRSWVGKAFPLLPLIDIGSRLSRGTYAVVLYRHNCPMCHRVIRRMCQSAPADRSVPVVLIELPPYGALPEECLPPGETWLSARLTSDYDWFCETPVVIQVRDGVVLECDLARQETRS